MVDDRMGISSPPEDPYGFTSSSDHRVDDILDMANTRQESDHVVEELVRVLDTILPLQPVAVNESEQVGAASLSLVVSTLPTDGVLTSKVIGTSVESQVKGNLGTQRLGAIMIESIRVPLRPSAKTNGEYQLPGQNAATVTTAVTTVSLDSQAQSIPTLVIYNTF